MVLILIAMLAIVFGMGLPTTSAYIIAAALGVSSLTAHDFPALNAHLFVFYFAVLSNMTPPVALAAFAAGTVAKDNPMKIALTAMRIGVVAFIVPFAFAYDSNLLMQGSISGIAWVILSTFVAGYFLSIGFAGFLNSKLNILERLALIGAGVIAFFPLWEFRVAGILAGILLIIFFLKLGKKRVALA